MATQVDGQALSDDDIVSILRNWIAGHGTVAAGLGILVFHLAQDLDLQHRLRADPALIGPAVDEILRVDDPLVANRRTTAHAVDIGERHIPVDAKLTLMWIAANRDENAFASPDVIDLDRDQRQNLVFGAGIHDCVGAPLARLELRVALEELLGQTSAIAPGTSDAPVRAVYPGNGFRKLPISLAGA
jgi:cytochrome P450